jgi:carbamoyl-phosphate synthase large subunit
LVPGVDEELLPVAQARKNVGCEVLLPPEDFVRMHLDKLASNSFLHAHRLAAPRTEWLPEHSQIAYPFIVKPIHGRGSRGVAVVRSEAELQAQITLSRRPPEDYIVQELLEGQEYTVMMAADRGSRLCAVVPVRVAIKRGITL